MANYPDFTSMDLNINSGNSDYTNWKHDFEINTSKKVDSFQWMTNEQIDVGALYTKDVYKDFEHLDFTAGISPYLRGPYATMYVTRPWTVRQ